MDRLPLPRGEAAFEEAKKTVQEHIEPIDGQHPGMNKTPPAPAPDLLPPIPDRPTPPFLRNHQEHTS